MESNRVDAAVVAKPLGHQDGSSGFHQGSSVVTGLTGIPDISIAGAVVMSMLRPSPSSIEMSPLDSSSWFETSRFETALTATTKNSVFRRSLSLAFDHPGSQ